LVRLEYRILTSCLADEVALPIVVIRLVVVGRLIAEALDTAEMVSTLEMTKGVEATVAAEAEVGEIEEEDHPHPTEDLQHRRTTEVDMVKAIVVAVAVAGEVGEGQEDRLYPHDLTLTMSTLPTSET
jgi:hypothetical protein